MSGRGNELDADAASDVVDSAAEALMKEFPGCGVVILLQRKGKHGPMISTNLAPQQYVEMAMTAAVVMSSAAPDSIRRITGHKVPA